MQGDLSDTFARAALRAGRVAWDIETTGLDWENDRATTCQVYVAGLGTEVVQLQGLNPTRLLELLTSSAVQKVFHHAAFDLRFMRWHWRCLPQNVACTKVLAKILMPGLPSHHSLQFLADHFLSVRLDKGLQTSDWTAPVLSDEQIAYSAADVEHLLPLLDCMYARAISAGLKSTVDASFTYLPARVETDLRRCGDIFSY